MRNRTFPQANNLNVLIDVLSFLYLNNGATDKEVSEHIGYEYRQGAYYTSSCYYFDLVDESNNLTTIAKNLFKKDILQKNLLFAYIIQDPIFGDIFSNYILKTQIDIKTYTENTIKKYFNYSDSVISRRASTVLAWIKDISDFILKSTE
ncbi:MAG: hypothetical protein WC225_01875 [Acholeplasmataceae bacterium]